jgi:hypothetical protein
MFLSIIGVVIGWFVLGWVINFIIYSDKPIAIHGTSDTAKTLHILINIGAVIAIIAILIS